MKYDKKPMQIMKQAGKAKILATSKKTDTKYKKAPNAPKRFKSAFIIFSAAKHKEIKKALKEEGTEKKTTDIAKLVSEAWKKLSPTARKVWDAKANEDKARYEAEKAAYHGPWKILSNTKKTKDPRAPKRPMSAFLAFSNSRRAALKRQHPNATNADLSKMLSKTWRELPLELKEKYTKEEAELREKYKSEAAAWREKVALAEQQCEQYQHDYDESGCLASVEKTRNSINPNAVGPESPLLSPSVSELLPTMSNPFFQSTTASSKKCISDDLESLLMQNKLAALQQSHISETLSKQKQVAEAALLFNPLLNNTHKQAVTALNNQKLQSLANLIAEDALKQQKMKEVALRQQLIVQGLSCPSSLGLNSNQNLLHLPFSNITRPTQLHTSFF